MKWTFYGLGGFALILFLGAYFGGRWAAQKYLAKEITVGPAKVRLVSPRFRWSLDLSADSAIYLSPALDARAGRTVVSADLFRSVIRFAPSVRATVDTLDLVLKPAPDTAKPRPGGDSAIAFPDLKLPAAIRFQAGRIAVRDTAGPLVRGDSVALETRGKRSFDLVIGHVEARPLRGMDQALGLSVSWEDSDQVRADLRWRRDTDSLSLHTRLSQRDLRKGTLAARAHLASTRPYARALNLAPSLPRAQSIDAAVSLSLEETLRATLSLKGRLEGFSDSAAYKIDALGTSLNADFRDSSGSWSLEGRGSQGESLKLGGKMFLTATDSLRDPAYLMRHAGITARGHLQGVRILAGEKLVKAELRVAALEASSRSLSMNVRTGEGSTLLADLQPEAVPGSPIKTGFKLPPWRGTFSAEVHPGERWVSAFADTNLVFRKFSLRGNLGRGTLSARIRADSLKAFGLLADSLRLNPKATAKRVDLLASSLSYQGTQWALVGGADLSGPKGEAAVRFSHPEYGSAEAHLKSSHRISAKVRKLALDKLPYRGLDSLKATQPRLSADFDWDRTGKSGHADARFEARRQEARIGLEAHAAWTSAVLDVQEARADFSGSDLKATARIRLRGREFYQLSGLGIGDIEAAGISSRAFDIAKALGTALPNPPLRSGSAAGSLAYSPQGGFQGTYRIQNLHLNADEEKASIRELSLNGKGDSLVVKAVTASAEPIFNDSLALSVGGLLGKTQALNLTGSVGPHLKLAFAGSLADFHDLSGTFRMQGSAALPQGSGELRGFVLRADLKLPLREGLSGMRLNADTLQGQYVVAGLDTQSFSAPIKMAGGKVSIPALRIKGREGAELQGRFEFDPATRKYSGSLEGKAFAAKLGKGDQFKLHDLKFAIQADTTAMTIRGGIGSGSAEHIRQPLRFAGDFSQVGFLYHAPLGKAALLSAARGGSVPYLRVRAVLDSSELRYRLRSMETLQNLFKRGPEQRSAKRENQMQVEIDIATDGSGNSVETDILRMRYVGDISMAGLYPYALVKGRVNSSQGELGTKKQSYSIRRMELKWANTPLAEGKLSLEADKRLARDCEAGTKDSCSITTRLTGELADLHFTYDSDCRSAYGGSVEVAALIYSVRRGCYSTAFSAGGSGLTHQEQALGLLEPFASQYLSDAVGKLSGHWIASAQVSGLGALATDKKKSGSDADSGSAAQEAIALEILSKEFWRTRLRLKSAYAPEKVETGSPWNYRAALEWRPPVPGFIEDEKWRNRIRNNVNVEAAVYTNPDRTQDEARDEGLLKRLGLNYLYGFWGSRKAKPAPRAIPPAQPQRDSSASADSAVAIPETIE